LKQDFFVIYFLYTIA